jgi:hypothetical protein
MSLITVTKFAAGVVDTGEKFAIGVVNTGGALLIANISANFQKNLKRSMEYSGAGGKLIHEKNPKAKNLVTLSL